MFSIDARLGVRHLGSQPGRKNGPDLKISNVILAAVAEDRARFLGAQ